MKVRKWWPMVQIWFKDMFCFHQCYSLLEVGFYWLCWRVGQNFDPTGLSQIPLSPQKRPSRCSGVMKYNYTERFRFQQFIVKDICGSLSKMTLFFLSNDVEYILEWCQYYRLPNWRENRKWYQAFWKIRSLPYYISLCLRAFSPEID